MSKNERKITLWISVLSIRFVLASIILILAAIGLRPSTQFLTKYYKKESIAVRKPLAKFDISRLPTFATGWEFKPEETIEAVETDEYAFIYLKNKDKFKIPGHVNLFVTYYSKPGDKVPHTPDVCYRQGGAVVKQISTITIPTPDLAPSCPEIKASLIILQMSLSEQAVIYLFCADGKFKHTRNGARWTISKPGNRYMYFSKIEATAAFPNGTDPTSAIEICRHLIAQSVPILVKEHFPTKQQLRRH